jgi:hypothetical protein
MKLWEEWIMEMLTIIILMNWTHIINQLCLLLKPLKNMDIWKNNFDTYFLWVWNTLLHWEENIDYKTFKTMSRGKCVNIRRMILGSNFEYCVMRSFMIYTGHQALLGHCKVLGTWKWGVGTLNNIYTLQFPFNFAIWSEVMHHM